MDIFIRPSGDSFSESFRKQHEISYIGELGRLGDYLWEFDEHCDKWGRSGNLSWLPASIDYHINRLTMIGTVGTSEEQQLAKRYRDVFRGFQKRIKMENDLKENTKNLG